MVFEPKPSQSGNGLLWPELFSLEETLFLYFVKSSCKNNCHIFTNKRMVKKKFLVNSYQILEKHLVKLSFLAQKLQLRTLILMQVFVLISISVKHFS